MLRRGLIEKTPEVVNGFRMRGTEVSRLEAFADCVFGFGLTLLFVTSQVPTRFDQLGQSLRGFVVFGLCFLLFYGVWSRHYMYCRRYGMEDTTVRGLTVLLLFLMLGFLYPLKFLAVVFTTYVLHIDVGWRIEKGDQPDIAQLFVIYGFGYAALQLVFALLYLHAYRQRKDLKLDELETLDTKWWIFDQLSSMTIPVVSIVMALTLPPPLIGFAGFVYSGLGLTGWLHGRLHGGRHRAMVARMEAEGRISEAELSTENDLVEVAPESA